MKDGEGKPQGSLRDQLNSVYRQTGVLPIELVEEPQIPECLDYVWQWFIELNRTRSSNGFSMNPISYSEIDSWARVTGTPINPFEVQLIKDLDTLFLGTMVQEK